MHFVIDKVFARDLFVMSLCVFLGWIAVTQRTVQSEGEL